MKVDCLGSDLFRGNGEIAFVFTVFVVDNNKDLALRGNLRSPSGDRSKIHAAVSGFKRCHRHGTLVLPGLAPSDGSIHGVDVLYALDRQPVFKRFTPLLSIDGNAFLPGGPSAKHSGVGVPASAAIFKDSTNCALPTPALR